MPEETRPCPKCSEPIIFLKTTKGRRVACQPGRTGGKAHIFHDTYHKPHSEYCIPGRKEELDKLLEQPPKE